MKRTGIYAVVVFVGLVTLFEVELQTQPRFPQPSKVAAFCHAGTHPDNAAIRRIGASAVDVLGAKVAARQFEELAGPVLTEEGGVVADWPPQTFVMPTLLGPKRTALLIEPFALAMPDDTRRGGAYTLLFRVRGLTYLGRLLHEGRRVFLGMRSPSFRHTLWISVPARDFETVCI